MNVKEIDTRIGTRLRLVRRQANLTQSDLGKRLGVSAQQIQKYESGKDRISARKLYIASQALNISMDWFLKESDDAVIDDELTQSSQQRTIKIITANLARIQNTRHLESLKQVVIATANNSEIKKRQSEAS